MRMEIDKSQLGKAAMLLALLGESEEGRSLGQRMEEKGFAYAMGRVGSMDSQKVVAAVETATKRNGVIRSGLYREEHALYHAIMEALRGVVRGEVALGALLRTVGLTFSVVRGRPYPSAEEGEWLAVAFYGTIGAPVKGLEHETLGLGINHI